TRSAKIPSVYYNADGSSATSILQGAAGAGGVWPLSRTPSSQRYAAAANGPRQSYDASQMSGELPARPAAAGLFNRPSAGLLASSAVYGIMRTGSGADRIAASAATPSHSEILPAPLRVRAELADGPSDSFRTVGDDPSVPLPALGRRGSVASLGQERSSTRGSPPTTASVVPTSNSVTASLRPYMGSAHNLSTAAVPEQGAAAAAAPVATTVADSVPSYSSTVDFRGPPTPHGPVSEPLYV
ncbi:hypothetical protein Vretifemale_13479, partial [Volvox reticuliferus]